MSWDIESFKSKVEAQHSFPGPYIFKFIVPVDKENEVMNILPKGDVSFKQSSNNKYVSVTLKTVMNNSSEVVEVYKRAYGIKGIVAL